MTVNDINNVTREITMFRTSYAMIMSKGDVSEPLHDLISHLEESIPPHQMKIVRSFSPIRELLRTMA